MTCFTEVALIFVDNPDPEGQGFCQAGFSVDFTKVTILPPLTLSVYFIFMVTSYVTWCPYFLFKILKMKKKMTL